MQRKKVLINTDYPLLKTGLGKNGRNLVEYLYNTKKYDLYYYACGMVYDSVEYERLPYTVHGTMPNMQNEMDAIRQKGEYWVRDCAYGGYNLNRILKEVKPDVFITSNDTWGSETYLDNPYIKEMAANFIPHKTYDSVPFLPNQIEYFNKVSKVYVWADFAVEEAKRLGKNNVSKITGIVDPSHFRKLSPFIKSRLRQKFGIPEDAFIVVKCSRNQIRKQFKSVMEGYAKWKKINNPTRATYLLFHTNFTEPHGWDFFRFADELSIKREEILTTYVCKKCKNYAVAQFQGNEHKCPFCHQDKCFNNINIQDGVDEEQLNEVYNLADCMVHGADAAGLEITCIEGLYAGLPLATNPYASLEMFTKQPFVHEIQCTFGVQHGTQFKRAVLDPNSIAKFLQQTYTKTPQEIDKISRAGREWALSQFSPKVVCKQWEELIDSLPVLDWDQIERNVQSKQTKDPNAIIEEIADNKEWVKQLYSKILKMNVSDNDSGLIHWLVQLQKGANRQDILNYFRHTATQEINKKTFTLEDQIKQDTNRKVLVVLKESIGDVIIALGVLESLRKSYAGYSIYFATDPIHFEILDGNPNIDHIIPYVPFMEHELACVSKFNDKGLFDVYINLGISTQRQLNYITNNNICI